MGETEINSDWLLFRNGKNFSMTRNTFAFIDESGDTGTKFGQGSSEMLTVALIMFENEDKLETAEQRINTLRTELRRPARFEFHFKDNSDSIRTAFYNAIAPLQFGYIAIAVDKGRWAESNTDHNGFYKQVCVKLLEVARPYLSGAMVKIDKSGTTNFRRELSSEIRRQINTVSTDTAEELSPIKSISMEASHTSNMIQMADMICGAIARSYRADKSKPHEFVKIIAHRQVAMRELPE